MQCTIYHWLLLLSLFCFFAPMTMFIFTGIFDRNSMRVPEEVVVETLDLDFAAPVDHHIHAMMLVLRRTGSMTTPMLWPLHTRCGNALAMASTCYHRFSSHAPAHPHAAASASFPPRPIPSCVAPTVHDFLHGCFQVHIPFIQFRVCMKVLSVEVALPWNFSRITTQSLFTFASPRYDIHSPQRKPAASWPQIHINPSLHSLHNLMLSVALPTSGFSLVCGIGVAGV